MGDYDWVYGVILITIGSLGNNLGNNLVALGHKESKIVPGETLESVDDSSVPVPQTPKNKFDWKLIGTIVFIVGNLFTFVSFGFGAQSLIASLESIQFVSNIFFAYYIHHEKITNRMIISTASIVVGNVLVVLFADHAAILYNSDDMIYLYETNTAYQVYLGIAFIIWAISTFIYTKYHKSRMKDRSLMWKHILLEPLCFAISSTVIGTQAVLNSKCMSLLIQGSIISGTHKNEFTFWYLYFILATWLLMVAYWLVRLNKGLELFPPLFIIPVMQVFFVFFAILCGGIYFEEFIDFTTSQYIGFIFGVLMILGGVYGLAPEDMVLTVPPEEISDENVRACESVSANAT